MVRRLPGIKRGRDLATSGLDLRLITAVFRPVVLLLFLMIGLSLALMAPFLWLVFSESFIHNRWFRFTILVNICIYWFWALAVTLGDVRAVGSMRRAPPRRDWFAEVPRSTQPWASDLVDAVEWRFAHLRWRTRLLLSFVPGVAYRHEREHSGEDWRMEVGLSTIAFLALDELTALLVTSALCRFRPVSRPHFLLLRLLNKAERGQSALPPHPGPFSFARCLIEGTVRALQPLPAQLEDWECCSCSCGRRFGGKHRANCFARADLLYSRAVTSTSMTALQ